MGYDPLERHRQIEKLVIQKRADGDRKKYYRFRNDRWYGGVITADCAGCGLICKYCWVRQDSLLEGRGPGEFLTGEEVAEKMLRLMKEEKIHQVRISGGEATIGRKHLLAILNPLLHRKVHFILETNGILIGEDETFAQDLALFPFVHVRVSLKGCSEEEFGRLTGADPQGFRLQLAALRNLTQAGVSAHPAPMVSFSTREDVDRFYGMIYKISPRMHSEIEKEELILYPHVLQKINRANLKCYSGHSPSRVPKGPI